MPLRVRLSIAFVAIVLVPLTVTAFLVRGNVRTNYDARASAQLSSTRSATSVLIESLRRSAEVGARAVGERSIAVGNRLQNLGTALRERRVPVARRIVAGFAESGMVDFVAVTDASGRLVASSSTPGAFLPGVQQPTMQQIVTDARTTEPGRLVDGLTIRRSLVLTDGDNAEVGRVIAGYWFDSDVLRRVQDVSSVDLTVVYRSKPVASTFEDAEQAGRIAIQAPDDGTAIGYRHLRQTLGAGAELISSVSTETVESQTGRTTKSIIVIIVVSLVMAALFGWLLARVTTRPLAELGDAALAVAGGRLDTRIEVRSRDEVGKLALAFNTMTDELRTYVQALQDSRDELKRNLTRLGDTLSSTHDLKKMLAVILETAMVTIRSEAGALMLFAGSRDELYLKVGRGLDGRLSTSNVRIRTGEGIAGRVAELGESLHGQVGNAGLELASSEPRAEHVIAVPLKSQGRVIGVLNLYDRVDGEAFEEDDVSTIRSFANQATVAIDNVLLHQEAQRLSITDGLTGLWNYRYFQMQFEKEIERASRFGRPLALLVMDLDKFKAVNDEWGHQRGDSVLIELATRVKGAIRDVDILARYGGEEFVLILPETDLDGAVQASQKVCELVRGRKFGLAGEVPLRITVSIGVAVYPANGRGGASLMRAADAALYSAKDAGRDGYWVADPAPETEVEAAEAAVRATVAPVGGVGTEDDSLASLLPDLGAGSTLTAEPVAVAVGVARAPTRARVTPARARRYTPRRSPQVRAAAARGRRRSR